MNDAIRLLSRCLGARTFTRPRALSHHRSRYAELWPATLVVVENASPRRDADFSTPAAARTALRCVL